MDALSKVIELAHIHGSLDLRCLLAGDFALSHESLPSGEAPFHLVLSGNAELELEGGVHLALAAGDFVLLPRGAAHVVRGKGHAMSGPMRMDSEGALPLRRNTEANVEMDLLCGRFTYLPDSADLLMNALPEALHVSLAQETELQILGNVVLLLRDEVTRLESGAFAIVTALSQAILILALRAYAKRDGMSPSLLVLLSDSRLSRAVHAMMREPHKPWTVESLAAHANMSRATFARHFAEKGAISPMDLLASLRMRFARELLEAGNLAVADVAERVGYQSESAFGKVFQKIIGQTPAAFRRQQK
jgi:AraC family transcriptional activator of mtrCDE